MLCLLLFFCSETISLHADVTHASVDREAEVHVSWNKTKKMTTLIVFRWFWSRSSNVILIFCHRMSITESAESNTLVFLSYFFLFQFWLKSWHRSLFDHFVSNTDKHDDSKEVIWKTLWWTFVIFSLKSIIHHRFDISYSSSYLILIRWMELDQSMKNT